MNEILLTIVVFAIGYILGCISTGILISKHEGVNIRDVGSKKHGREQRAARTRRSRRRVYVSG